MASSPTNNASAHSPTSPQFPTTSDLLTPTSSDRLDDDDPSPSLVAQPSSTIDSEQEHDSDTTDEQTHLANPSPTSTSPTNTAVLDSTSTTTSTTTSAATSTIATTTTTTAATADTAAATNTQTTPSQASANDMHGVSTATTTTTTTPAPAPAPATDSPEAELDLDALCVVCFERPPNVTLDPCGHANLCDICVSRLVKRRCPTCRARARKVTIRYPDRTVTKAVREVIAERKQRESRVLEETLQIVFLGPEKVGKKTLVRKLIAKFPLVSSASNNNNNNSSSNDSSSTNNTASSIPDAEHNNDTGATSNTTASATSAPTAPGAPVDSNDTATTTATATTATTTTTLSPSPTLVTPQPSSTSATTSTNKVDSSSTSPLANNNPAAPAPPAPPPDVFSDGTDFSPNATIGGANVRLTVLRRTTLASRRMVLDDVRVLKPDVLVLCCSAHGATFDSILSWDKVLRNNFQKPRVWALLTLDEDSPSTAAFDAPLDVSGAINAIFPSDLRPKGHYFCSLGETFSVGFRSLAKDIVSMGRIARDEELAASIALEEARTLADQEAAGTLGDHVAANLVIANNGITMPSSSSTNASAARQQNHGRSGGSGGGGGGGGHAGGRGFSLRALRERGGNGQGISLSGLVSWLAGSHES